MSQKKRWIIPHVYDVPWLIFESLCLVTVFEEQINLCIVSCLHVEAEWINMSGLEPKHIHLK